LLQSLAAAIGRLCCKSSKFPGDKFPATRRTNRRPAICVASIALPDFLRALNQRDCACNIDPPASSYAIMRRAGPYRGENSGPGKDDRGELDSETRNQTLSRHTANDRVCLTHSGHTPGRVSRRQQSPAALRYAILSAGSTRGLCKSDGTSIAQLQH